MPASPDFSLDGMPIVVLPADSSLARLAAGELARYLHGLTEQLFPVRNKLPKKGDCIVLDTDTRVAPEGYRLEIKARGPFRSLVIAGADMPGVLYGAYALLEQLGIRFTTEGDLMPADNRADLTLPGDFEHTAEPLTSVRGVWLTGDWPRGPSVWGLEHFRASFDQLARLRFNTVLVNRDHAECTPVIQRTSDLPLGLGRCFDEEFWASPAGDNRHDSMTEARQAQAIFRAAVEVAAKRGLRVAAGYTCPTDPGQQPLFRQRLHDLVTATPQLARLALWVPPGLTSDALRVSLDSAQKLVEQHPDLELLLVTETPQAAELCHAEQASSPDGLTLVAPGTYHQPHDRPHDQYWALDAFSPSGSVSRLGIEPDRQSTTLHLARTAWGDTADQPQPETAPPRLQDHQALLAFADQLSSRDDWGLLVESANRLGPQPPRLTARGLADEVWLSWEVVPGATDYRLERRGPYGDWKSIPIGPTDTCADSPGDGAWTYRLVVTTPDGDKTQSHEVTAWCGEEAPPPRILACRPYTHMLPGEGFLCRVIVRSDRELGALNLAYRLAGDDDWWATPMHHRFRDSYQAVIPSEELTSGTLEFFVEAMDVTGNRATWPAEAESGSPWRITIAG